MLQAQLFDSVVSQRQELVNVRLYQVGAGCPDIDFISGHTIARYGSHSITSEDRAGSCSALNGLPQCLVGVSPTASCNKLLQV